MRVFLLLAAGTLAALAADISGKYTGTLEVPTQDGGTNRLSGVIELKQDGSEITGSAGPNESERHPLRNIRLAGDKLTFELAMPNGRIMSFDVTADGTSLQGTVRRSPDEPPGRLSMTRQGAPQTARADAGLSGKWKGTMEFQTPQGARRNPVYMDLKQEGTSVSGFLGPNEQEPHQVKKGRLDGNRLTFIMTPEGQDISADLTVDGDSMTGEIVMENVEGKRTAKIAVKRER